MDSKILKNIPSISTNQDLSSVDNWYIITECQPRFFWVHIFPSLTLDSSVLTRRMSRTVHLIQTISPWILDHPPPHSPPSPPPPPSAEAQSSISSPSEEDIVTCSARRLALDFEEVWGGESQRRTRPGRRRSLEPSCQATRCSDSDTPTAVLNAKHTSINIIRPTCIYQKCTVVKVYQLKLYFQVNACNFRLIFATCKTRLYIRMW